MKVQICRKINIAAILILAFFSSVSFGWNQTCDLNGDGYIEAKDFSGFTSYWLDNCTTGGCLTADFNGDNTINFKDYALFASNWKQVDPQLLAHYQFSENYIDSTGHGNDGIGVGNANTTGGVLNLDGVNSYMNCNHFIFPQGSNVLDQVTICAKIKTSAASLYDWTSIISGGGNWDFRYGYDLNVWECYGAGAIQTAATVTWDGYWHHIAAVLNVSEGKQKLYIDGTLAVSVDTTGAFDSWGNPLVGAFPGWGAGPIRFFNGQMDEVRFYSRALTETEIIALFAEAVTNGPLSAVEKNIGVPTIKYDGQWLTIPGYSCLANWPNQLNFENPIAKASPVGTKLFDFPITTTGYSGLPDASTGPTTYNWSTVDLYYGTARTLKNGGWYDYNNNLISANPNVILLPRLCTDAPAWWLNDPSNQSEMEIMDDGTSQSTNFSQYGSNPGILPRSGPFASLASAKYRQMVKKTLEDFIDYAKQKGYLENTIGFEISTLATEEGYWWGSGRSELAGFSVPTRDAFRQWLRTKYNNSNTALQASWNNPSVTFDTAQLPTRAWRLDRLNSYTFRDIDNKMSVVDFYQFWSDLIPDFIDFCADVIKNKTANTKIVGAFYAYMYEFNANPEFGHNGLGRFLKSPNLDYAFVTSSYFNRGLGGVDQLRGPAYSTQLHNKLWFHSDDMATVYEPDIMRGMGFSEAGVAENLLYHGYSDTYEKNKWQLRRVSGFNTCNGFYQHHLELWALANNPTYGWLCHYGMSSSDPIAAEIGNLNQFLDNSKNYDRSSNSQILAVIDEYSCGYTASMKLLQVTLRNPQLALQRIGAPVDQILLDDLSLINPAQYKMIVFLNCWNLNDTHRSVIDSLKNNNRMLVFCYAGGYFNGKNYSSTNIKNACGMNIEASVLGESLSTPPQITIQPQYHPLAQNIYNAGLTTFGSTEQCCRMMYAADSAGTILGFYPGTGWTNMAITEPTGWKGVWMITSDIPAGVYRELAKFANVHIYNHGDDALYANKSYVTIHPGSAGNRTIYFPYHVTIYDALTEGAPLATNVTSYTRGYQLGETMIYRYVVVP
jgi:hypothetical protein